MPEPVETLILCIKPAGGPYDAVSFVAGMQLGEFVRYLQYLKVAPGSKVRYPYQVFCDVFPTMDLLAAAYGLVLSTEPAEVFDPEGPAKEQVFVIIDYPSQDFFDGFEN